MEVKSAFSHWNRLVRRLTLQVAGVLVGFQVKLCENGLWVTSAGAQRGLDGVVERLLETSGLHLARVRIPHDLQNQQKNSKI